MLGIVMGLLTWGSRRLGMSTEDEITIVFCGSKKSLVSGVPMANVLFSAHVAGAIIVPLMVFHQMQLMVCAVVAARYARRGAVQVLGEATSGGHAATRRSAASRDTGRAAKRSPDD